ncbi:hypothetical protein B4135_1836 [Caldibacillus debilis]|uniref:Uncharacterized protein n=1 Tax=Caldibacillus debilis TaxID=301148 RepID=A0A150M858_9BACI|nr:hypothetical protein B4135_1836 [Caldibacillus debilis]
MKGFWCIIKVPVSCIRSGCGKDERGRNLGSVKRGRDGAIPKRG